MVEGENKKCLAKLVNREGFIKIIEVPFPPPPIHIIARVNPLQNFVGSNEFPREKTVERIEFYLKEVTENGLYIYHEK